MRPNIRPLFSNLVALSLVVIAVLGCNISNERKPQWTKSKTLADKLDHPSAIAADDKFIYFVTGGTVASQNEGTNNLMKMPLDGGAPIVLFKGGKELIPDTFAIALDEKFVYWTSGAKIHRTLKENGSTETVTDKAGAPPEIITDNENVYWINFAGENSPPKPIQLISKQGGEVKTLTDPRPSANGLCVDEQFIYWVQVEGLYKISKTGGDIVKVYSPPEGQRTAELAQDAENFYFTQGESKHALMKLSKKGGEAVQIAPSVNHTYDLVVDQTHIYFVRNEGSFDTALCKVPKDGGDVVKLDEGHLKSMATGKSHIFFTDISKIYSIAK